MRTFKLVTAILCCVIFPWIMFQSCAMNALLVLSKESGTSGAMGMLVAICILIGGICMIINRDEERSSGAMGSFAVATFFALQSANSIFKDMYIYLVGCIFMTFVNLCSSPKKKEPPAVACPMNTFMNAPTNGAMYANQMGYLPPMTPRATTSVSPNMATQPPSMNVLPTLVTQKSTMNSISEPEDIHIQIVKRSCPNSYPDCSYGYVLSDFFSKPSWSYLKDIDGSGIVEFTGYFLYKDAPVKANINFVFNEDGRHFYIASLVFNGKVQEQYVLQYIISKVFDKYGTSVPIASIQQNDADLFDM